MPQGNRVDRATERYGGNPKEMIMGQWHNSGCVLCGQNCGLEILVEDNRIARVRPDKDNVRSEGYVCRKGMKVANH
jgi:anaerobic selenocysteine-containing dehydrogenase